MSLQKTIMADMKTAMKTKDKVALEALRAIKAAILVAQTESGAREELDEGQELKILQRLVKQRKDSATLYSEQGRDDLAEPELAQVAVIEKFLPTQLSEEELVVIIKEVVEEVGASSTKDMGKVMGAANKKLAGKAEGRMISVVVKNILGAM
ncbi:MAG: GatB/YqeY domain-containing protein [Flavobacteriales bacterium]|nr:GatB/YqeY domain-containing protein [Flavobacteriales bacterium]